MLKVCQYYCSRAASWWAYVRPALFWTLMDVRRMMTAVLSPFILRSFASNSRHVTEAMIQLAGIREPRVGTAAVFYVVPYKRNSFEFECCYCLEIWQGAPMATMALSTPHVHLTPHLVSFWYHSGTVEMLLAWQWRHRHINSNSTLLVVDLGSCHWLRLWLLFLHWIVLRRHERWNYAEIRDLYAAPKIQVPSQEIAESNELCICSARRLSQVLPMASYVCKHGTNSGENSSWKVSIVPLSGSSSFRREAPELGKESIPYICTWMHTSAQTSMCSHSPDLVSGRVAEYAIADKVLIWTT